MYLYDVQRGLALFSVDEANTRFSAGGDILATQLAINVTT